MKWQERMRQDQEAKFGGYVSLDLANKIYQVKARAWVSEWLGKRKGGKILEIGCADGGLVKLIADETGQEPYGVDISKVSVREAGKKGIRARVADAGVGLPYKSDLFELVLVLEVIEHVLDTDRLLSECRRVLKKGGYLIISTPNLASLPNRVKLLMGFYPKYLEYSLEGAGHIRAYTLPTLVAQMERAGFEVVRRASVNITFPWITKAWMPSRLKRLAMRLGDWLPAWGSHLLVAARK